MITTAEILRVDVGPAAERVTTASLPDDVLRSLAEANPGLQ